MAVEPLHAPETAKETPSVSEDQVLETVSRLTSASVPMISADLGAPEDSVATICRRLARQRALGSLKVRDLAILITVAAWTKSHRTVAGAEWITTPALHELVEAEVATLPDEAAPKPSSDTYRRCCRLEERLRMLDSRVRRSTRRLYFFPVTGQVLTNTNYAEVQKVIHDLKEIARRIIPAGVTGITPPVAKKLLAEYRRYLRELIMRTRDPRAREQILRFERQLMAVIAGSKKAEVIGLFGLRPFHPMVREWRLARGKRRPGAGKVAESIRTLLAGREEWPEPVYVPA
jgi:hypothetical protein